MFATAMQATALDGARLSGVMSIAFGLILVILAVANLNIARMFQLKRGDWVPIDEPGPVWGRWIVGFIGAGLMLIGLCAIL